MPTLRLLLGDQLSKTISSLRGCDLANDVVLLCELWDEVGSPTCSRLEASLRASPTHL